MTSPLICGFCALPYAESENFDGACRYHPEFYFPYDIDKDGVHAKGWQCCGSEDPKAQGCRASRHRSDIKKVFFPNSIQFIYEEIMPWKEACRLEREKIICQKRMVLEQDPEVKKKIDHLNSFKGRTLGELESLIGSPVIERQCSNGSSGFIYRSLTNFYRWEGLFFRIGTVDFPYYKTIPRDAQTVEYSSFYADEEEMKAANDALLTDLSS